MAGKKKLEGIDLDEILLREVASRRSPSGSVLNNPTAQTGPPERAAQPARPTLRTEPKRMYSKR